jgi:hypothetical protein
MTERTKLLHAQFFIQLQNWLPSVLAEENDILEIRARPFSHVLNPHLDQAKEATMTRSQRYYCEEHAELSFPLPSQNF